jgi:hypothetical protein
LPPETERVLALAMGTTHVADAVEARLREADALEREELLEQVKREAERDRRLVDALARARGRDQG